VFRDESRQEELEPLCAAVLEHFAVDSQPLCCIFDNEERGEFTSCFGESFCGFFYPIAQFGFNNSGCPWPFHIRTNITDVWREIENGGSSRDVVLVYLRKDTCEQPTGTTITFAHELQHVIQRSQTTTSGKLTNGSRTLLSPRWWTRSRGTFPVSRRPNLYQSA